jgi:transcriptional regulator with XRE-family HTH domain
MKQKKSRHPTDVYVGSRLRMRPMMLGVTQEKLSEGLGVTFQQVQKYEKGVNRISASRLQHLSHLLKVSAPFFFEGAPMPETVGRSSAHHCRAR